VIDSGDGGGAATATPPSRTDWAIERIRRAILFGDARPGDRLVSSAWSVRLGISQTPLREAFQRLAAEGFVDYDPQRGARVAPLTLTDACEIYDLRLQLEPGAVESSVAEGDDRWLRDLTEAFVRVDEFYAASESIEAGAVEAHRTFHRVLRSRCVSVWLLRITDMLADHSTRMQFASISARGGRPAAREEHRRIYEAARTRDAALTSRLTAAHLQRTLDALQTA
jgi:GntR family transcriptional regulator, carbon starvation induced regulator